VKLAVLVSGRGSNLAAILEAGVPVELVVCNVPEAPAIQIAADHHVPVYLQPRPAEAGGRAARDQLLVDELRRRDIGLLALAGYNQILSESVVDAYPGRIVNVHPSLLPAFVGGMAPVPQRQALEQGVKVSGCTVHLVTREVDAGPILAQATVPVLPDDTVESLSQRILAQEHRLLPEVLRELLAQTLGMPIAGGNTRDTIAAEPLYCEQEVSEWTHDGGQ